MFKVPGDLTQLRPSAQRAICILAVAMMAAAASRTAVAAEQGSDAGQSCSKYLPSIGRTVEAPCESTQPETPTEKTGDLSKLPVERLSLRVTLGRVAEGNSGQRTILGVKISDVVPPLAKLIEVANAKVLTNDVTPQSAAELAGVRPGDIILTIDGLALKNPRDLAQLVLSYAPGSEVTLEIARVSGTGLVQSLRDHADAGSIDAMMALAPLLRSGLGDAVKNDAEAARWYRKAAELGNADAMDVLGSFYESGFGFAKDEAEAARWYRKSADLGHAEAMNDLGILYVNGRGVAKDDAEAARWFRKAADLGNADAMYRLGLYTKGMGVAKDDAEAGRWLRKAADLGHAGAMNAFGILYEQGHGVAKDDAEAARGYRKAADGGSLVAMRNLGALYNEGRGVPRDVAEAARWVFSAIEHGDAHTIEEMTNRSAAWSLEFRKALQDRLRQAGVYSGPSDGTFGPSDKDALAALAARAE